MELPAPCQSPVYFTAMTAPSGCPLVLAVMSLCHSTGLHNYLRLSACPFVYMSLTFSVSVSGSVSVFFCLSVFLSVCLSVCPFVCLCMYVCLSVSLLSLYLVCFSSHPHCLVLSHNLYLHHITLASVSSPATLSWFVYKSDWLSVLSVCVWQFILPCANLSISPHLFSIYLSKLSVRPCICSYFCFTLFQRRWRVLCV